ncbi:MAG: MarR family transcriptional regulator [Ignavibacteriae bacterium]|nr:MarR family transcriptional regulator [Ignavibacteriota bacterium]MCB0751732.1 MarR family transcriptional regulator [Ignavibacteriota bacterium]MCB9208329.1 MarR family transcriptional regulator [Ignavibacteriales bacterium]MCB9259091.1 MarR family transcriptional regulator [Ignavibacteriales bacterium]
MKYYFNESIGFIIVKAGRLIENKLKLNFEKENIDITPQQWSVLTYLWNEDGISQQELADAFSKDKTSMTRLLNNMEKNQLISRQIDSLDKRNKKIFLTNKSKLIKKHSIKIAEKTLIETLGGIDHKDLKISKKVLKQINKNLED